MTATAIRAADTSGWAGVRVWLGRGAVAATATMVAGVLALVLVIPMVTGGAARSVLTGSMSPALPVGSLVLDRPVSTDALRVGDIATYRTVVSGRSIVVTHRIVAIDRSTTPASITFRGDANRSADPLPIPATDVRGRVWLDVPWLGSVRDWLISVRWLLIGLGALCLSGYAAGNLSAGWRERRAAR